MKLEEALKSGKRFKTKDKDYWLKYSEYLDAVFTDDGDHLYLYGSDVVRDDWEIEQSYVEITEKEFTEKFTESLGESKYTWDSEPTIKTVNDLYVTLKKKLGFLEEDQ